MGRVEENSHLKFKAEYMTDKRLECAKISFLEDISRSLALMADCQLATWQDMIGSEEKERDDVTAADLYVRDHMLIEFMQSCIESGTPVDTPAEEWYEAWEGKLKELEARHKDGK